MSKQHLNKNKNKVEDIDLTDDEWAMAPEPDHVEIIGNLRLDADAAARYREVREAREKRARASDDCRN